MNILVLSINYAPEATGFAPHVADLCGYLVRRGHRATVATGFPFAPHWSRWKDFRGKLLLRERIKDVDVLRVTHFIPRRPRSVLQRLLMEGTFCVVAGLAILLCVRERHNLILYVGAQPSVAMLARLIARWRGMPYVVAINDLAVEAGADVGIIRSRWLASPLRAFEYAAYRGAAGAIVLCPSFRDALVARGFPANRIRTIPCPVDLERVRPLPDGSAFRESRGLAPGDFVVLYSGSLGLKQDLLTVVEAAHLLRHEAPVVRWVIVGDGELRPEIERRIASRGLEGQVRLLPLQPEESMSAMFASADVLLLSQVSNVKDTVIPSKLLTYMAAGRPVLAAVNPNSQGAAVLREGGGGLLVSPEDPAALATAVRSLRADREKLEILGKRNRRYAEAHFDRKQILDAQESFLIEIVEDFTGSRNMAA